MQTSTYPRASEHSDNRDMRHLSHRSAIACKLGTAIVLLLHSLFGCTWAHGGCNNHRSPIAVGSQAHSSCQHTTAVAPQEAQLTHPVCEHQHDDHPTSHSDRVDRGSCGDHATPLTVNALAKKHARRLLGEPEKMQPLGIRQVIASSLGCSESPSLSTALIHGHFQQTWQSRSCTTAPAGQPCSDHSDPCCSTLHCSFLTVTAETLSIDLGSLFPQAQMAFAIPVQKVPTTVLFSRPGELMCVGSPQPHCALLCVWQV